MGTYGYKLGYLYEELWTAAHATVTGTDTDDRVRLNMLCLVVVNSAKRNQNDCINLSLGNSNLENIGIIASQSIYDKRMS